MYITQEYDFYEAITKKWNMDSPMYQNFDIIGVNPVLGNVSIVDTTHGKFWCETCEDEDANIFMKVIPYV